MHYTLKIDSQPMDLEVETEACDRFAATIGGQTRRVQAVRISDHRIHLTVDGCSFVASVADTPEGKAVAIDGRTWIVEDAETQSGKKKGGPANGPKAVSPPMPALVTRILVQVGDRVAKGQALVVVSAMKMETTLAAPFDGRVTRINAAEGDKVTPKQVLVDLEAD